MKRFVTAVVVALSLTTTGAFAIFHSKTPDIKDITCEEYSSHLIGFVLTNVIGGSASVLKVYDVRQTSRNSQELNCKMSALITNPTMGDGLNLRVFLIEGDIFHEVSSYHR